MMMMMMMMAMTNKTVTTKLQEVKQNSEQMGQK